MKWTLNGLKHILTKLNGRSQHVALLIGFNIICSHFYFFIVKDEWQNYHKWKALLQFFPSSVSWNYIWKKKENLVKKYTENWWSSNVWLIMNIFYKISLNRTFFISMYSIIDPTRVKTKAFSLQCEAVARFSDYNKVRLWLSKFRQ